MASEHDEGQHAVLAPSAAERWISCPASVRMSRNVPEPPSNLYADEGTAAHALCELEARHQLITPLTKAKYNAAIKKWRKEHENAILDEEEMRVHAQAYVELLREKSVDGVLMLEQRVPTGVPSCWGTSDAVIVSWDRVIVVDLKYGKGIQVEAEGNPQLRLYAVGALEAFGDVLGVVKEVEYVVFQPRLDHCVSETILATELRAWRDSLIPIAESALGHDAPFGPSDKACRWCPASGQCVAQMEYAVALDFGVAPEVLDPDALADALERIPQIEAWCSAVKEYALDLVYSKGGEIPGYKVVLSGGRRSVTDPDGAIEALKMIGYTIDQIAEQKIKGIGALEKLLGKEQFATLLAPFVAKGEGSPSLVPESDSRQSTTPNVEAAKEFADG